MSSAQSLLRWIPVIFVLIWSTGFIAAKFALPYIEPNTMLFLRKLITLTLILLLIMWLRSPGPGARQALHLMPLADIALAVAGVYLVIMTTGGNAAG